MGLLLAAVIGWGIYLYCKRKRVRKRLAQNHLAPCKRCGCAVDERARSCPDCGTLLPTRNVALDLALGGLACYFMVVALSEITGDADPSGPAAPKLFDSEVVEPRLAYLPRLAPADVYLSLEEIGFATETAVGSGAGHLWTSVLHKNGMQYQVDIRSDQPHRVQRIRGTASNAHQNLDEVKRFFIYVASSLLLHNRQHEETLNSWIEEHFNSGRTSTSVGAVNVRLSAPSKRIRRMVIEAGPEDGR